MKLVFIYGPPAVGKLTVAREVAKQLGFRLFHSHLAVLVARSVFPGYHELHEDRNFRDLLRKLRLDCIAAAAEANKSLVFTVTYAGTPDNYYVGRIVRAVTSRGGTVHFVQLTAPDEILMQRAASESRRALAKMTDANLLRSILESRGVHDHIKHHDSLVIDTHELSPTEAAAKTVAWLTKK